MAGLFHPLLCSFCGFTALFPKGTVLLQLLFACLFQGVTLFCVFPVVDRQCLVLARQCRKKKVSWALLPLLTDHILSCRRHWSLPTRSNGGRLMQGDAAQCYSHASMFIGSLLTRKCLPRSSPDSKKEFSEMCSFRKRWWP